VSGESQEQRALQATSEDWRALGFHYERDDEAREWRFTGSRSGLLGLRDLLIAYVRDPGHAAVSEHEHYGPYLYFEVMTWPEAGLDAHALRGPLSSLERLAHLVAERLAVARPGERLSVREEFAPASPYSLVLFVQGDDFDPASADPELRGGLVATRAGDTLTDMEGDSAERMRQRSSWPVKRVTLGQESDDLSGETTAADRIAMMWPLALEAWRVAGLPIPEYERKDAPSRLVRGTGE